ncbi:MAG: hypothetical protein IJ168_07420 [Eubacterium sp.]|nr:hypothetical protein [Eubacterium sp.]
MENKIREGLTALSKKLSGYDKRVKVLVALGLVGMLLVLLSEALPAKSEPSPSASDGSYTYQDYVSSLEESTETLIGAIDGVGRCRVMITLKGGTENIYAKNSDENRNEGSYSGRYEYVLYDGASGEEPLLLKEYLPAVQGVAVVCDGADNSAVRACVTETVSALFDISVSKVSVTKYKS